MVRGWRGAWCGLLRRADGFCGGCGACAVRVQARGDHDAGNLLAGEREPGGETEMKRLKVLFVLFACMAVMGVVLVMALLAKMLGLTAKMLTIPAKLLVDTAIAVQRAGIGLYNTARGWLRWAVR